MSVDLNMKIWHCGKHVVNMKTKIEQISNSIRTGEQVYILRDLFEDRLFKLNYVTENVQQHLTIFDFSLFKFVKENLHQIFLSAGN